MDFTRLVESGEYSEELLTDSNRRFIEGMKYVLKKLDIIGDIVIENYTDNNGSTLDRMRTEIMAETVDGIKEVLEREINEAIVSLIDAQENDY